LLILIDRRRQLFYVFDLGTVYGAFVEGDGSAPLLSIFKNKNRRRI
jgi:hypothetical protein